MKRTTSVETDISLANVRCPHGRQRSDVARPVVGPDLYVTVDRADSCKHTDE
jgi:hypothetical protein